MFGSISRNPREAAVETDYSVGRGDVGHTIMFAATGAGKSVSIAELLRTVDKFFLAAQEPDK